MSHRVCVMGVVIVFADASKYIHSNAKQFSTPLASCESLNGIQFNSVTNGAGFCIPYDLTRAFKIHIRESIDQLGPLDTRVNRIFVFDEVLDCLNPNSA